MKQGEDKEQNIPEHAYLELAFPRVFDQRHGRSHVDCSGEDLFADIKQHVVSMIDAPENSILPDPKNQLEGIQTKMESLEWAASYYSPYGGVLIMHRENKISPPNILLVFPANSEMQADMTQCPTQLNYLAALEFSQCEIGQLTNYANDSVEDILAEYEQKLQQILQSQIYNPYNRQKEYSPRWLTEAAHFAIELMESPDRYYDQDGKPLKEGDKKIPIVNVGISNHNMDYMLAWALLDFFAEDCELIRVLELSYSINLLCKSLKARTARPENLTALLSAYMLCLQDVRGSLVDINGSANSYYHNGKVVDKLKQVYILILNLNAPVHSHMVPSAEMGTSLPYKLPQTDFKQHFAAVVPLSKQTAQIILGAPLLCISLTKPIYNLYQAAQNEVSLEWMHAMEDIMFSLAVQELPKQVPYNLVDLKEIALNPNDSFLTFCIENYILKIDSNPKVYGMGLNGQAASHKELMKALGAVIAFEVFKRNMKNTIDQYSVPINANSIVKNFNSLSLKARKAAESLFEYKKAHENKPPLLSHAEGYYSWRPYFLKMAKKDLNSQRALIEDQKSLETNKKDLIRKYEQFLKKKKQYQDIIDSLRNSSCLNPSSCSYYSRCIRCSTLKNNEQWLQRHVKTTENYIKTNIPSNEEDAIIHHYISRLDSNSLGLFKALLLGQNQFTKPKNSSYGSGHTLCFKGSVDFYYEDPKVSYFYLDNFSPFSIENNIVRPPSIVELKYNGDFHKPPKFQLMNSCNPILNSNMSKFNYMFQNPEGNINPSREHKVYANYNTRPKTMGIQEYQMLGACRVGRFTQLPLLLEGLEKRVLNVQVLQNKNQNINSMVLKIVAELAPYKPLLEQMESAQISQISEGFEFMMRRFMDNYFTAWSSKDFLSLPIVGPLISLFSSTLVQQDSVLMICQWNQPQVASFKHHPILDLICGKTMEEYARLEEDITQNASGNINVVINTSSSQSFICHAGLCLFTQPLIGLDTKLAVYFAKFIVAMRFKELYLLLNIKSPEYLAINETAYYRQRAIDYNIRLAKLYFDKNPAHLTQVVELADEGIHHSTEWEQLTGNGPAVFQGVDSFQNEYVIDLKSGKITKNGSCIARVPEPFKNSKYYQQIFQKRDFEVYPNASKNALRVRRDFKELFSGNINVRRQSAFFEFQYTKSQLPEETHSIVMVFRYENEEGESFQERWRLVSLQMLAEKYRLPSFIVNSYLPWYCENLKCIMFRKRNIDDIGEVGFVMFFNREGAEAMEKIHVISKQHGRQHMHVLYDRSQVIFDKLILRDDSEYLPAKILSRLERPEFILEMESYKGIHKFYLHRYRTTFTQDVNIGLIPQTPKHYKVAEEPFTQKYLPWNEDDGVSCLVLQKIGELESTQQLHKFKLLIPNLPIDEKGRTVLGKYCSSHLKLLCYDLHDHFHCLRGVNRNSQLQLACLLLSRNTNLPLQRLHMTAAEYCLKVLNSCFSNAPFDDQEIEKVTNILTLAACHKNETVILTCHALLKTSYELLQIGLEKTDWEALQNYECRYLQLEHYREYVAKSINSYKQKLKRGRVPLRQRLSNKVCTILGIRSNAEERFGKARICKWRAQNPLKIELPSEGIEFYIAKSMEKIEKCDSLRANIMKKNENLPDRPKYKPFPLSQENEEKSVLLGQVLVELKESHEAYQTDIWRLNQLTTDKNKIKKDFIEIVNELVEAKHQTERILRGVIMQKSGHIDIFSGYRPTLSKLDFVQILMTEKLDPSNESFLTKIVPDLTIENRKSFVRLIEIWMLLTVRLNSCERIKIMASKQGPIDKVALFRECESPRKIIEQKFYWVCFEVEMKIQIWASQYQTYRTLMKDEKTGIASQLNMGEGKTQIIIPMITLELLFGDIKKPRIPRVNLLNSLFSESRFNYFRFLSATAFNVPIVELPFDRSVNLQDDLIRERIALTLSYFKGKMMLLLDQSSTHSLILKLRECAIRGEELEANKEKVVFNFDCFDIFDEVDAQMHPKKSFIYSIGTASPLDEAEHRTNICIHFLEAICKSLPALCKKQYITFDESQKEAKLAITEGRFPKGLRYVTSVGEKPSLKKDIHEILFKTLVKEIDCSEFKFLQILSKKQLEQIKNYILDDTKEKESITANLTEGAMKIILVMRGLLAYGVFDHCLLMRCRVHYGIPSQQVSQKKRLAVPYEAADVPSKKNNFAHPDVTLLLSLIAYYNSGIAKDQFEQCLDQFFKITEDNEEARDNIFQQWLSTLDQRAKKYLRVPNSIQIKRNSVSQMERMYQVFKENRECISFWLRYCVFPKDMSQFDESITSSSWDHIKVPHSVGFSGTKDNSRLFPTYIEMVESQNNRIKGTDGKMIQLLLENTSEVINVADGEQALWERFLMTMLKIPEKSHCISAIIDAGAILAGKSLRKDIIPWLSKNKLFNPQSMFKGVSYCLDHKWKVFKLDSYEDVDRGTIFSDDETFVIFDEYRTRGADMKMDSNATAVLSVSPSLTKDALMQAVGRLRKLGRNQKVIILLTSETKEKIMVDTKYKDNLSTKDKVKEILFWSCLNSVRDNQKFLLPNVKLAKKHLQNLQDPYNPKVDKSTTDLAKMYEAPMSYKSIAELSESTLSDILVNDDSSELSEFLEPIRMSFLTYGKQKVIKAQNFDEVCQREIEIVKQIATQVHVEENVLKEIAEDNFIKPINPSQYFDFQFDIKFQISSNFYHCTTFGSFQNDQKYNELMCGHFLFLKRDEICLITLREVQKLILGGIPFYTKKTGIKYSQEGYIARIMDLSTKDQFIQENVLERAFLHCLFFNGERYFEPKEKNILKKLFTSDVQNAEQRIKFFLQKRRIYQKYKNSSLNQLSDQLMLLPPDYQSDHEQQSDHQEDRKSEQNEKVQQEDEDQYELDDLIEQMGKIKLRES